MMTIFAGPAIAEAPYSKIARWCTLARVHVAVARRVLFLSGWLVACSSAYGGSEPPPAPPGSVTCDADLTRDNANCGRCGLACGAAEYCAASSCVPGCPQRIVHVATSGDDSNTGCAPSAPKKTIASALSYIATTKAQDHEVHVCAGIYPENVTLRTTASILGAYECSTWQRSLEGQTNATVVHPATTQELATFILEGPGITDAVRIDGLTINAPPQTNRPSVGVVVRNGASPRLLHLKVHGGAGEGSFGVSVEAGSRVEIDESAIDGGEGHACQTCASPIASIGLVADGDRAVVRQSAILGGRGTLTAGYGAGSFGVLQRAGDLLVERTLIDAGVGQVLGKGVPSLPIAARGIFAGTGAAPVTVTIRESTILSSSGPGNWARCDPETSCRIDGVAVGNLGVATIERSRIAMPELLEARVGSEHAALYAAGAVDLRASLVHGGSGTASGTHLVIDLQPGAEVTAIGNTIAVGRERYGFKASGARLLAQNNLLLAGPGAFAMFWSSACNGNTAPALDLKNNALLMGDPATPIAYTTSGGCTNPAPIVTMDAFQTQLGRPADDNVRLTSSCGTDSKCLPVPSCNGGAFDACARNLLEAWDESSKGIVELLGPGWKLRAGSRCEVTRGATTFADGATDLFGARRTERGSMGAHEYDGPCATP